MRTITFKQEASWIDPVHVGDILRIRRADKWHTVIAVNEGDFQTCEGCIFDRYTQCTVPYATGSGNTLCDNARCVFKEIDEVLEDL